MAFNKAIVGTTSNAYALCLEHSFDNYRYLSGTSEMIHQPTSQSDQSHQLARSLDRQFVLDRIQANSNTLQTFNIQSLELFGSVARDEAALSSDLDFLVEFKGPATLRGYMGLKSFLEDLFGCSVDLVSRKKLKPIIRDSVLKEAIRVA
nr:nucleotidyltransferase family protein [cf. Phormidesmis sp. LEGE 11477]